MTNLNKAERLYVAGAIAPTLRNAPPRKIKVIGSDGKAIREISNIELADAILARAGIELAVSEDVARLYCACGKLLRSKGSVRCRSCNGRAKRGPDAQEVVCPGCGKSRVRKGYLVRAAAAPKKFKWRRRDYCTSCRKPSCRECGRRFTVNRGSKTGLCAACWNQTPQARAHRAKNAKAGAAARWGKA